MPSQSLEASAFEEVTGERSMLRVEESVQAPAAICTQKTKVKGENFFD